MEKTHSGHREIQGVGKCLDKLWFKSKFFTILQVLSSLLLRPISIQTVLFLFSFLRIDLPEETAELTSNQMTGL